MDLIDANTCVLVLVDYQARLMPVIQNAENVATNATLLAQAAQLLGIPVIGTEQNPQSLGPNVEQITSQCRVTIAKTHFNACADGLLDALHNVKPDCDHIVIAGCESHVCMMQTALGLLRAKKRVWIVANACGSRRPEDHELALNRLTQAGATIVNLDMVLFEWLKDCGHPHFKDILKIIKAAV